MKKPILIVPGILCLCLACCAPEGDAAKKKSSVSIGRFGVRHQTVAETPEAEAAAQPEAEAQKKSAESARPAPEEPVNVAGREPSLPAGQKAKNEGIRLPNMLSLPEDRDLKATNPASVPSQQEGGVISRPPVEKKD